MTVGQLKKVLEDYDDDTKVAILPTNTYYIESASEAYGGWCDLFDYDEPREMVVIEAGRQIGHKPE